MPLTLDITKTYNSSTPATAGKESQEALDWSHTFIAPTVYDNRVMNRFAYLWKRTTEASDESEKITFTISHWARYTKKRASDNYNFMIYRVLELMEEEGEEDDEYGAVVPTKAALRRAMEILGESFRRFQTIFPLAPATVSFDGGVRIQWMLPDSSVRLVIPGNEGEEEEYIYFELNDTYGTEIASASNLDSRIKWLQRESAYAERLR